MDSNKIWTLPELRDIAENALAFKGEGQKTMKERSADDGRGLVVRLLKPASSNLVIRQEKIAGDSSWTSTWWLPDRNGVLHQISKAQAASIDPDVMR